MAVDLADCVSAVPRNAVAVSLLSVAHGDDTLRIPIPRKVVDAAVDDAVFAFGDSVPYAVPNTDQTRSIAAGNVKARRREAGHGRLGFVFGILLSNGGVVD